MGSIQMKGAILNDCAVIDVDMTHILKLYFISALFFAGPGKKLDLGVMGRKNIEGALKTVDLEKILSHMYLGRIFLKIHI